MKSQYLELLWWYCQRPGMYRDLIRRMLSMGKRKELAPDEEIPAHEWCERVKTTREAVFQKLSLASDDAFKVTFKQKTEDRLQELQDRKIVMGGGGDYALLYAVAERLAATCVVETGVSMGFSSLALLMSVTSRGGTVYSTDRPYLLKNYDQYVGCLVPEAFHDSWKLFRIPDKDGLRKIFRRCEQFDLVHYDSDKSKAGRLWGYEQLWSRLRNGGIFISDDIGDNLAFKEFCQSIGKTPIVLKKGVNYLGIIEK